MSYSEYVVKDMFRRARWQSVSARIRWSLSIRRMELLLDHCDTVPPTEEVRRRASEWFQRVAESTAEHVPWPIPYVRSFYFLGKIHEKRGEMQKAREYYQRFLSFWKDGDMDREWVEEAKRKI